MDAEQSDTNKDPVMARLSNIRIRLLIVGAVCVALVGAGLPGPANAVFPGANGKIAFMSTRDGNQEIYVMNADGTGQTNLTNTAARENSPSFSPDGERIVFSTNRDGNEEIYVMNVDGTGQTNLTNHPSSDFEPTFSADGQKIAFASTRDGNQEIYVMNADGTGQARLTNNAAADADPVFSPDGQKIAFETNRDGNVEIYVMNADGTGQTNLTNNPSADHDPDFSPAGSVIVFDSLRDGNEEIYVMSADGAGSPHNLTNSPSSAENRPAYSPDGHRVAFDTNRDGNHEIYVMSVDGTGTGQTNLTNNPSGDLDPDWQPLPGGLPSNSAPDCSGVAASPSDLWPPDGRFRDVSLDGVSDPDGDEVRLVIKGVTQDEPVVSSDGRKATAPDARLSEDRQTVQLRAERDPRGDGRVYRIEVSGDDGNGGSCAGVAFVGVRHEKGGDPAVDSGGSYDSLAG